MFDSPLPLILVLLAASVFVVTLARRLGPAVHPGLRHRRPGARAACPRALFPESDTTHLLAELGVVFLLFTLGLEFSWPRMVALRREVFGLGALQVFGTAAVVALIAHLFGIAWAQSIVLGGVVAMSSTVLIVQQLTERAELNRTHGRLAFSVVLFQDIAVVPFLALAAALAPGSEAFTMGDVVSLVAAGTAAVLVVLAAGRWLLRPLLYVIANSRLRELFTLAVLLVALASAWASQMAGLLDGARRLPRRHDAGRNRIQPPGRKRHPAVPRHPARPVLHLRRHAARLQCAVARVLAGPRAARGHGAASRRSSPRSPRACSSTRTSRRCAPASRSPSAASSASRCSRCCCRTRPSIPAIAQPMLVAVVLGMVLAPVILANNKRVARLLLGERGPPKTAIEREDAVTLAVAKREHVILCGFGRVGQNVARVLEAQGFEYIAIDLDAGARARRAADRPARWCTAIPPTSRCSRRWASPTPTPWSSRSPITRTSLAILRSPAPAARRRAGAGAHARRFAPARAQGRRRHRGRARGLRGQPHAGLARADVAQGAAGARHALGRRAARQSLRDAAQRHRARRRHRRTMRSSQKQVRSVVLPPGSWCIGKRVDEVRQRRRGSGVHRHPPPGNPRAAIPRATRNSRKATSW